MTETKEAVDKVVRTRTTEEHREESREQWELAHTAEADEAVDEDRQAVGLPAGGWARSARSEEHRRGERRQAACGHSRAD